MHEFDRRGTVRRCAIAASRQNPRRRRVSKVQGRRTILSDQRQEIVALAYGSRTSAAPCGSARRPANLASFARRSYCELAKSLLQCGIATVDFPAIYVNIAAL